MRRARLELKRARVRELIGLELNAVTGGMSALTFCAPWCLDPTPMKTDTCCTCVAAC